MVQVLTGRWEDRIAELPKMLIPGLAGYVCDSVITDPPYGERTHRGAMTARDLDQHGIGYAAWNRADVRRFVRAWAPVTRRWIGALTSHDLIPAWEAEFGSAGLYAFAPVPCVIRGMGVRLQGDGPASWTVYLMTARARSVPRMRNDVSKGAALWRALPGAYVCTRGELAIEGRGKPRALLDEIVRDYSNPGDRVIDPCAGLGTTLASAAAMGREAIGIELDPEIAGKARALLAAPMQLRLA